MTCLCKNERTPPATPAWVSRSFFGSIWPSLPSLAGSVWTLCSLCCALQADARPPRSTCRGRRSLSLATGCPSPRPRCGTHLAEVRPERLTSPTPPPNPRLVFWFFSSVFHDMIFYFLFLVVCLLEPVPGDWFILTPSLFTPPPLFSCCIVGNRSVLFLIGPHIVTSSSGSFICGLSGEKNLLLVNFFLIFCVQSHCIHSLMWVVVFVSLKNIMLWNDGLLFRCLLCLK